MKKIVIAMALLFSALSVSASEQLFRSSYFPWKLDDWGSVYKKIEPITMNREALPPQVRAAKGEAFAPIANNVSFDITVDGVGYEAEGRMRADSFGRVWKGSIEGAWPSHLVFVGDAVAGRLNLPNGQYREVITRSDRTFVVEIDEKELSKLFVNDVWSSRNVEASAVSSSTKRRGVTHPSPTACGSVDLLLLVEASGFAWYGSMNAVRALALSAVEGSNITNDNSKSGPQRVRLAGVAVVDYTSATLSGGKLSADWTWMYNSSQVQALGEEYKADVIGMVIGGTSPNAAGLGYPSTNKSNALFVAWGTGGGAMTIQHEFGHTAYHQGHEPIDWTNPSPSYATDHSVDGVFGGVMSSGKSNVCPHGCPRIQVYANPDVFYQGFATGLDGVSENWRMPSRRFPEVSMYRISGTEGVCAKPDMNPI